jgi:hypothetical protein
MGTAFLRFCRIRKAAVRPPVKTPGVFWFKKERRRRPL